MFIKKLVLAIAVFAVAGSYAYANTFLVNCAAQNIDTQAIQDAIDAAEAAGGGIVQLPSGTCYIDDTLLVEGDSNGNAVLIRGAMPAVINMQTHDSPHHRVQGPEGR
jgi:polygalacturonase